MTSANQVYERNIFILINESEKHTNVDNKGETMWSNALCTLGVTKPICNCLSIRQVAAAAAAAAATQGATITAGPTASSNTSGVNTNIFK